MDTLQILHKPDTGLLHLVEELVVVGRVAHVRAKTRGQLEVPRPVSTRGEHAILCERNTEMEMLITLTVR